MLRSNFLLCSAIAISVIGFSSVAKAASVDVDASLQTQQAISLTKNNDMNFGIVEYDATHGGFIRLATNGTVTLSGASGIVASGSPNAADVSVSGDGASVIEISCETGGTLEDSSANTLTLSNTEISTAGGGVAWGGGTACAGLGTAPATVDLSVTATPTITMGGQIDVSGNAIASSDTYSTTNGGGDPVTLQVVYQ